ncbi:MAG: hypothetical protein [Wendovervirus sonii]|uniref:Uncharacterized protein n=1 Tax=phage Lak_Megaphage_Sonny TaxID=3109229 RepID=A0ABZ0Z3U8_9CAUD|nr:MAG: hypothetical protein [phage Lak_Megaphage_Sonny]
MAKKIKKNTDQNNEDPENFHFDHIVIQDEENIKNEEYHYGNNIIVQDEDVINSKELYSDNNYISGEENTIIEDTENPLWTGHNEWNDKNTNDQMPYLNTPERCVILCMCCNNEYYQKEYDDIMNTWGKRIISGEFPNIDIWGYTASDTGTYEIDIERKMLKVPSLDDRNHTFIKTTMALDMLKIYGFEYDWFLKINCSTTVNLKMLNKFMQINYLNEDVVYVPYLMLDKTKSAPYFFSPILNDDFILFSKKYMQIINGNSIDIINLLCNKDRLINEDIYKKSNLALGALFNTNMELKQFDVRNSYAILPTHYINNLYDNNEQMTPSAIAIFNKPLNEYRNIRNYYYDLHDRYMHFYNNFYNMLDDNITELQNISNTFKTFIIEKGDGTYYHIPFDQYLTDDMMKLLSI